MTLGDLAAELSALLKDGIHPLTEVRVFNQYDGEQVPLEEVRGSGPCVTLFVDLEPFDAITDWSES